MRYFFLNIKEYLGQQEKVASRPDLGNSAVYSRCEYGKASHVRDFPYCLKCMLECHILSVKEMR